MKELQRSFYPASPTPQQATPRTRAPLLVFHFVSTVCNMACLIDGDSPLLVRRVIDGTLGEFFHIIQSGFQQQFSTNAFFASLGSSLGISLIILLLWCLIRPYNSVVYAPKLRNANEKHAPPAIEKGYFAWFKPLIKCQEADLVEKLGLDAIVFLRFLRMCRMIFFVLGIIGCLILIPVNVTCNLKSGLVKISESNQWLTLMTPSAIIGRCMWAHVIIAWIFDFIIMYILYSNYTAITRLRKDYFEGPDYQASLHARTLMVCFVVLQNFPKIADHRKN